MASFNLTITYPDNDAAALLAALRAYFGHAYDEDVNGNPVPRDRTPEELKENLEALSRQQIKRIYRKHLESQVDSSIALD